jgi:hypothetical protein
VQFNRMIEIELRELLGYVDLATRLQSKNSIML